MTRTAKAEIGAPSSEADRWEAIDWPHVEASVRRLQMRIAKAFREKRYRKAKALQWLLTHSHHAKLLAVKRVTQKQGAKTPGVDQICWNTPKQKMQAAQALKRRGYTTLPLRRVYVPKKIKGKLRPISIPSMQCRAMQMLHLLALDPIVETIADRHAYGFRPRRSAHDAIEQCFKVLARRSSARYILEGDIKSCFDEISHPWLCKNIPTDKRILKQWLQAGYIEKETLYPTKAGTPQGGIISPALLNVTLSGLEKAVKAVTQPKDKVNVCVYADDFIITGATREVLENIVQPAVETFLRERGLRLSQEKTQITSIEEGFDFLGFNLRKYNEKLIIKPSKASVTRFLREIRQEIKSKRAVSAERLIQILNPKIRGWTNYYRHVCSKKTFSKISHEIFCALWRWAKRRHSNKNASWVKKKYFRTQGLRQWVFTAAIRSKKGKLAYLDLFETSAVRIWRHIKIRANANPYDPAYAEYFKHRKRRRLRHAGGICLAHEWTTG